MKPFLDFLKHQPVGSHRLTFAELIQRQVEISPVATECQKVKRLDNELYQMMQEMTELKLFLSKTTQNQQNTSGQL